MQTRGQRRKMYCHVHLIYDFFYEKEGEEMPKLRSCMQDNWLSEEQLLC